MTEDATRTPFDSVQRELGAEMVDALGWAWATTFGDPLAEYRAVRDDVGLWDASAHTKWEYTGRDALAALDRIFTRDLSGMETGQVCYGPFCDDNGKMLGDGTVFRFADDRCWLVTAPGTESDLEHFQRVVSDLDVSIRKRTLELPQLCVTGPRARELMDSLSDSAVGSLPYFRFLPEQIVFGGVPCWVSRTGYSGEVAYELFFAPDHAEQLWRILTRGGARPYGLSAIELFRIESGLIAMGADFFPRETSPFDMSLDRFVHLQKQEFAGKDALKKEATNPPSALVTLVFDGPQPANGAAVMSNGTRVGTLTSACESPELGRAIGLAVLRRHLARDGEIVEVEAEERNTRATVAPLAIVDPKKLRPRA